jgi:hypothetical protein
MSNTTFFNRNDYKQQRHRERAEIRRKALDEVNDEAERLRELEVRQRVDGHRQVNSIQPK